MISEADFHAAADGMCPGPDLEWFGVDADGYVAGFTNAGFALVPAAVFGSYSLYHRTLDTIDTLPCRGRAEWIVVRPPRGDTWDDWSVRGLFAYDWNWNSGSPLPTLPYRQVCRPTVPLHVSELPADIAGYIGLAAFTSLGFADAVKIDQGPTPFTERLVGSVPADRYRPPYGPAVAVRLESFAVGLSRDYTRVRNLTAAESRALAEYLFELALRNPCGQLDAYQDGLLAAVLDRDDEGGLIRKAGIMGVVRCEGTIRCGDPIRVVLPPPPHRPLDRV